MGIMLQFLFTFYFYYQPCRSLFLYLSPRHVHIFFFVQPAAAGSKSVSCRWAKKSQQKVEKCIVISEFSCEPNSQHYQCWYCQGVTQGISYATAGTDSLKALQWILPILCRVSSLRLPSSSVACGRLSINITGSITFIRVISILHKYFQFHPSQTAKKKYFQNNRNLMWNRSIAI